MSITSQRRIPAVIPRLSTATAVLVLWVAAAPAGPSTEKGRELPGRVARLENVILAPCCYAEPVSHHQSEIAVAMRREIRDWVYSGKTDREILDTYKARYGARVLIEPEGRVWLWTNLIPWLVFGAGVAAVWVLILRWRARPATSARNPLPLPAVPETEDEWIEVQRNASARD